MTFAKLSLAGLVLLTSACATAPATRFPTPKERVTECQQLCTELGLRMSSLVVVLNATGCVCEPVDSKTSSGNGGAAAVMAGALVHQQEEEQEHALGQ